MALEKEKEQVKKVTAKDVVKLKSNCGTLSQTFGISQANRLLQLSNAQWKLADEKYKWNGTEIAKV